MVFQSHHWSSHGFISSIRHACTRTLRSAVNLLGFGRNDWRYTGSWNARSITLADTPNPRHRIQVTNKGHTVSPGKWLAKMEEPAARAIVGKCGDVDDVAPPQQERRH